MLHQFNSYLLILQRWKIPHKMRRTLIPARIMMQIQLMIILRIPPRARLEYLRRDRPALPPLPLRPLGDLLRLRFLLGTVVEDGGAVLRAGVHALSVLGRRIVHLVEEFKEGGVLQFVRVEGYLKGFGV